MREAVVWFDGYFGRLSKRCSVIGETPKRYRVIWRDSVPSRGLSEGDLSLVPKHAVSFDLATEKVK